MVAARPRGVGCGCCSDLVPRCCCAFRVVCAPAVQLPPLRWRCSASASRAAACWQILPPLPSSPAVLCCSAFCFYRALAWLLGRASGWLLGRYSNLWRVFRCLAFIAWRLCRRCFGCRCDDLRGGCCSCWGRLGRITAVTSGGGFAAISGALQTCGFKQIASLMNCLYFGGCGGWAGSSAGSAAAPFRGLGLHSTARPRAGA